MPFPPTLRAGTPSEVGMDSVQLEQAFAVLQADIDAGFLPGAVALVAREGVVVAHRALGVAHAAAPLEPARDGVPRTRSIPMRPDTIFDLASLTKVVATLPAALLLLERGEFRLDDPVCRFLPAFASAGKDQVKMRHLLTHTSGLAAGKVLHSNGWTREQALEYICALDPEYMLGGRVLYSDLGFIVLGEVVSRIAGTALDAFCRQYVLGALGMDETGFRPVPALRERIAATEFKEREGGHVWGVVHDENAHALGGVSGHAGLFSTARDLAVYGAMWLAGGCWGDCPFLSPATVAAARRSYTEGLGERRGLGWMLRSEEASSAGDLLSSSAYGHTGFTGTSLWMDPESDLLVVLLTNRVHFGRTDHIARLRPRFHNAVAAALRWL